MHYNIDASERNGERSPLSRGGKQTMVLIPERLFKSILAKADRLFEDGYCADVKATVDGEPVSYTVSSPDGEQYEVSTLFEQCTCPCFAQWRTCKHLRGI